MNATEGSLFCALEMDPLLLLFLPSVSVIARDKLRYAKKLELLLLLLAPEISAKII